MGRHLTAVGALLTASAAAIGLTAGSAAAATTPTPSAAAALRYLATQVGPGGAVAGSAGATEDVVISEADNGYDPATLRSAAGATALSYLVGQVPSITTAGAAAKLVLAWVAAGRPAALDGAAVLTRLNAPAGGGGFLTAAGTFHATAAAVETANSYSQSLAILADVAAHHPLPARATAWLTCAQRVDGGFGYVIVDTAPTPPAFCGDTASDTNDTGIVLEALGAAGRRSSSAAATTYLRAAQQADGGFGFSPSGPSDPDSDAVVIQGLIAIGQDPTTWTVGGTTPLGQLQSFVDPHGSGGYVFPGNSAPDAFTTAAVPQALALKPYGAAAPFTAGLSPVPATPSPTAAPAAGTAAITVPTTGAGAPLSGRLIPALALLFTGAAAIVGAAAVRRRRVTP